MGVMGVVSILLLWLSQAGAALAGRGRCRTLVRMALLSLPEHQAQIHFGRQGGNSGQLSVPGIAGTDWYLA